MKTASLVMGILSIVGMLFGFIPCLGAFNWLNIPFAVIGLIISIIALNQKIPGQSNGNATAGLVMCAIAVVFGLLRLILGGGVV
ncbi:MAG: hypothetical protein EOO87_06335 [Pedobacter sp.]|nr:MAG: hypothetical protein EOO87_06335 [Pedobacter sp.]